MTGDDSATGQEDRSDRWDVVLRPHVTPLVAYAASAVVAVAAVIAGVFMGVKSTGVASRTADQIALAGLGLVVAGAILLLARPRLRVGPGGLSVRNLLGYRLIPWRNVVDVSFPIGARWARVDLPNDEYVAVLAIQAVDRDRAVAAMDVVRELSASYRPPGGGGSGRS